MCRLNATVGLKTYISFVVDFFPVIKVAIGCFSYIHRSERHSFGFTLHSTGVGDICGMDSHLNLCSSSDEGTSAKKIHNGFVASLHTESNKGSQPSLTLLSIRGKMSLHTFLNLVLNHPIIQVGFAQISIKKISEISTTTPSKFIAYLCMTVVPN